MSLRAAVAALVCLIASACSCICPLIGPNSTIVDRIG